ncbi:MAG: SurA N-terminal domain-containing protein [Patescibacteria group bacterium]
MAKKVTKKRTTYKKDISVKLPVVETQKVQAPARMPRKLFLYGIVVLMAGALIYFGARLLFVATVNGQPISRLSVVEELEAQGGRQVLDVIILKTIVGQEAKKRKIEFTRKEVDAELAKIEKNIVAQGLTLDALLSQQGMTKETLADQVRIQGLLTKMIDNNVNVTEKEVDDYLASQQQQQALGSSQLTELPSRSTVKDQIRQQKLQQKMQSLISELKAKAKITYLINY